LNQINTDEYSVTLDQIRSLHQLLSSTAQDLDTLVALKYDQHLSPSTSPFDDHSSSTSSPSDCVSDINKRISKSLPENILHNRKISPPSFELDVSETLEQELASSQRSSEISDNTMNKDVDRIAKIVLNELKHSHNMNSSSSSSISMPSLRESNLNQTKSCIQEEDELMLDNIIAEYKQGLVNGESSFNEIFEDGGVDEKPVGFQDLYSTR